ncbi:c-type cytochrome [Pseudoduganella namucuonensis]|uniref:Cytochrome c n=1 Tax=Pseudoduganella namucuonensis TaxID=1035707 RepID=A0A1I7LZF4_9BURK|nr:c-type cytochrome [Pseudoduganella namucuonensis]SFV14987.1 cytochrome c [Pseudoduganella namucuonensis]
MMRAALALIGFAVATATAAATTPAAAAPACNVERGARAFETKCAMCHTAERGQGHMLGPNLSRVLGRRIGGAEGFRYSPALSNSAAAWDEKTLDLFLKSPAEAMPGTAMPFTGIKNADERAAAVCYLKGK